MQIDPTEEILQLQESLAKVLSDGYDIRKRARIGPDDPAARTKAWATYADMGLLALSVSTRHEGFASSARDLAAVVECMATKLTVEPYVAALLAARAIDRAVDTDAGSEQLAQIMAGARLAAWAHSETGCQSDRDVTCTATRSASGSWAIKGRKRLVPGGDAADTLVVTARCADGSTRLILVAADAPGLSRTAYALQDGTRAADLDFVDVQGTELGSAVPAAAVIAEVTALGLALNCASAVGAMQESFRQTLEYTKVRQQFGRPISQFQAVQHRLAEMYVALEEARSMSLIAAAAADAVAAGAGSHDRELAQAQLVVNRNGRFVCQQSLQLHGGIGMTEECLVGHYWRRQNVCEQLFGNEARHLAFLAGQGSPETAIQLR
ncbi:MAG: acyl-CoA dehydrogenase family protein [Burkholderiaceae bacterium]